MLCQVEKKRLGKEAFRGGRTLTPAGRKACFPGGD